jgi:L-lactate dehydrogenase complex protein LldG
VSAKAEILGRVRDALGAGTAVPEVPRAYRGADPEFLGSPPPGSDRREIVARFCERVADYRATVHRVSADGWAEAVADVCRGRRLVSPPGWNVPGLDLVADDPPLSPRDLDALDGVVTGCELAIAETGTIVLVGRRSGRRAISLVPDYHACVVDADDIVPSVPDAVARLARFAAEGWPITLVSGPSATSDIELDRVEGVHGPRTLDVFVVEAAGR